MTQEKISDEIKKAFEIVVKDNDFYQTWEDFEDCTDDNECLFCRRNIIKAIEEGIKIGIRKGRVSN